MSQHATFENEIRKRLARMERELRFWRLACVVMLSLATVVTAGAMNAPEPKELRARTLRIMDQDGKDRIVLTAEPKVPDMTFLDPAGKSRLTLDIADDQLPVLSFSETDSVSRLTLGSVEGKPVLSLIDQAGKRRVVFGIPKIGGATDRVLDQNEPPKKRVP